MTPTSKKVSKEDAMIMAASLESLARAIDEVLAYVPVQGEIEGHLLALQRIFERRRR
jgi:hypothetical protein